jgi:hypothetical protein
MKLPTCAASFKDCLQPLVDRLRIARKHEAARSETQDREVGWANAQVTPKSLVEAHTAAAVRWHKNTC